MKESINWAKIASYFSGEASEEDKRDILKWIEEDPDRKREMDLLWHVWKDTESFPSYIDANKSWNQLNERIKKSENNKNTSREFLFDQLTRKGDKRVLVKKKFRLFRRTLLSAAVVVVVFMAGIFSHQFMASQSANDNLLVQNRVFITQEGERATYQLADGSTIDLHAGSRLEIPNDYNLTKRELFLEGEAFFKTAHNAEKPFIVHSKNSYTRVIGTQFLVQSWAGSEDLVEVIVTEGRVIFGDNRLSGRESLSSEVVLEKNQRGTLRGGMSVVVDEVTDINWYIGWKDGVLWFDNRELCEVLPRLEKWYDITFQITNPDIANRKITAEIDYSLPMSDVLQGMAMSLDLEIIKKGDRIYEVK